MKNLVMVVAAVAVAAQTAASEIPSAAEVRAVGKYLAELTKGDATQLRQRKITKEQYADAVAGYADEEKRPAAKFALLRDAFKAYVDAKAYDKANDVYSTAQAEGGTEYAIAVVDYTAIPFTAKELKSRIDGDKNSYRQIGVLKKQLVKSPDDGALLESLGLEYAAVGNWEDALGAFGKATGELAKVAEWERSKGDACTAAKAAEFWWDYADGIRQKSKMEAVRLHAAMWYELAIGDGAYSGNELKIVRGRIDETKSYGGAAMQDRATLAKQIRELKPITLPMNAKLSMEFVGVPSGEFSMGSDSAVFKGICLSVIRSHKVKITRDFWLAKYKMTKEVWAAYANRKPELTAYDKAVGGARVPQRLSYSQAMDMCEHLTKKFRGKLPNGYVVRLPTEAEWEYALKMKDSGEDSPYRNWWKSPQIGWNVVEVRKMCDGNGYDTSDYSDWQLLPVEVGRKPPNGLGLFDMLGNGSELVLDTFDPDSFVVKEDMMSAKNANQTGIVYADNDKDPLTYFEKCWARGLTRSGRWHCNPYRKAGTDPNVGHITVRLCIGPDLMKEKGHAFRHKNK